MNQKHNENRGVHGKLLIYSTGTVHCSAAYRNDHA